MRAQGNALAITPMAAKLNREDVSLGALITGQIPTDTTTTPAPTGLPNRAVDWQVLKSGTSAQVLTTNADGSIGWAAATGGFSNPMTTAGDTIVGGTSGAATRLGIGSTGQSLMVSSGSPAWGNPLTVGNAVAGGAAHAMLVEDASSNLAAGPSWTSPNITVGTNGGIFASAGSVYIGSSNVSVDTNSTYNGFGIICAASNRASAFVWSKNNGTFFVGTNTAANTPVTIAGWSSQTAPLLALQQFSSTSTERSCGYVDASFNTSTDASWTGNLSLYAGDYTSSNAGKRLGVQVQSNGSAALVGLFGATPVVQPTAAGTTTGYTAGTSTAVTIDGTSTGGAGGTAYTLGDIVLALKSLGIIKT